MKRHVIHRIKLAVTALLVGFIAIIAPVTTAYAIDLPDAIEINDAKVYRNLVETGDFLVVYRAKINYDSDNGTYPTLPASSSIILRFYADNGTLLASAHPYVYSPFETNGYGDFVSGFYFNADNAPTWGTAHWINIEGLPAYFSPLPTPINYVLQATDYNSSTDTDANQLDLYNQIISYCDIFKSIYPDVELKSTVESGTVLSPYGEAYFKSAIPGLENLCPALFDVQIYTPEVMPVTVYDTSLADTMAGHTSGGDLERGMNRAGDIIGVDGSFMWGILTFVGVLAICIFCMRKDWGLELGMAISTLLVVLVAVLIGDFMFNLMMIIALVAAIGIMWIMFLRRA